MFSSFNKKFVWFCVGLHLAIVLPLAWTLNLWLDEAWTLKTTDDIATVWTETVFGERQAPLYFFLLAVWRIFDDSLFFARLFSVFCAVASIFVFDKLAKRLLPENYGKYAAAFFAVHPFLIWTALEARLYALAVLFSVLLMLFWHKGYAADGENKPARAIYVLLSIIGLYAYYFVGFLLVANAAALVVLGCRKQLKSYLWQMAIVGVGIVPLLFIIKLQFSVNADYVRPDASLIEAVRIIWQHFLNFALPADLGLSAVIRLWLIRLLIVVLIVVLIKNKARNLSRQTLALAAIVAVSAAFFFIVYFLLGATYLEVRHVATLFVPVLLFLASLLFDVVPRRRFVLIGVLIAVFYAVSLFAAYSPLAKRGDWARIAAFIETNERLNEPVIVFRAYDELPLGSTYRGVNRIVLKDQPHELFGAEDKPKTAARWRRQIETIIAEIPPDHERLWLITEETCDDEKTIIECQPLEDFVREHYVVERTEFFFYRKVRLLRRK